jgi:imidazolonepropionase-like amidohydrolase
LAFVALAWIAACRPSPRAPSEPDRAPDRPAARNEDTPPVVVDDGGETWLIRGARVMTATGVIYERGDVLVRGRRIADVGASITVDDGVRILDGSGKTVTPGLIDTHSHIGVYGAPSFTAHSDGNEIVAPVTAHVRAQDGYWPQDPTIDRARAGGVTTMQILPGSANLIGGRSVTVKTYPGALGVEQARFRGAPEGLKMACGENPKRVYADKGGPGTRMGNVAGYRAAFIKAKEYARAQASYREKLAKHEAKGRRARTDDDDGKDDGPPDPPARDLGLETLAAALRGEILVHNHCYRADEMLAMLAVADEMGFRIRSFHHAVEAYKIAPELAKAGTSASVWADWWGFKAEAFDGVRENAAILSAAGARAIIHSDSGVGIQHLNQEASKALWAGRRAGLDLSDDEALRWITINAAWALGVHDRVGTLERGKHADLVVWDGDPFSVYSKAEQVFIEGKLVYDRAQPDATYETDFEIGFDSGDGMGERAGRAGAK